MELNLRISFENIVNLLSINTIRIWYEIISSLKNRYQTGTS